MLDSKQYPHVFSDAHPFSEQFRRELMSTVTRPTSARAGISPPEPDRRRPRVPDRQAKAALSPAIDIHETSAAIVATAELPGLGEGDVEITIKDGVLTLRGQKRLSRRGLGDLRFSERSYGSFARAIALPDTVIVDQITAVFDKGVLQITLPKRATALR